MGRPRQQVHDSGRRQRLALAAQHSGQPAAAAAHLRLGQPAGSSSCLSVFRHAGVYWRADSYTLCLCMRLQNRHLQVVRA